MTISGFIREGLRYARSSKSLWLFGFFVGLAAGGSGGGGGGGGSTSAGAAGSGLGLSVPEITSIVILAILATALLVVMRFISEGALIEGVVHYRQGGTMTTRDGFRAGWAHWGVLLRIGLLYFAVVAVSIVLLAAPAVLAFRALGAPGAVVLGVPALAVAIPWLITVFLVQAFGSRIAVLENRGALDALRKARLFLHGRLMLGLRLIVAMFLGTLVISLAGFALIAPIVLLLVSLVPTLNVLPVMVLGGLVVLPASYVLVAAIGMLRSSIWTIGYLSQVDA